MKRRKTHPRSFFCSERGIVSIKFQTGDAFLFPFSLKGVDAYPLRGWRWIEQGGQKLLMNGQVSKRVTTAEAFDMEISTHGCKDAKQQLSIIRRFLSECSTETVSREGGETSDADGDGDKPDRHPKETTSPLEDYLWRGDDPVLKDMPWHVYSM